MHFVLEPKSPGIALLEGDLGMGDVRIRTFGNGLSYKFISGLHPLGPVEEEFLESLSK